MPFLGSTPADQYQSLAKQTITGDGSTAYTLNRSVTNAYDMEVFINNVRQEPDTSYSASGNTITFTAAVTASDSCYLIYQGQSVGSINPPVNSVGTSQIANNTITTAHLHTGLSVPDSNIAAMAASKLTGDVPHTNMPTGSILQVTHGRLSNTVVATGLVGNDYIYDIGLSASITPKFSTSNILINVNMYVGGDQSSSSAYLQSYFIYKNGSELDEVNGDEEGGRQGVPGSINMYDPTGAGATQYALHRLGGTHMDYNVGATATQTYSIRTRSYSSAPTIYINRSQTYQSNATNYDHVPQSTITLMEIAA